MTYRLDILWVMALALVLVDCKHAPSEAAADPTPVADCLAMLDSQDSLTMDTPFVATGPVIAYEGEPVPAAEFRRFSMLYADAMAPRTPDAVVEAFAAYWVGKQLADEAGVEVTRGEVNARFEAIAQRFPDDATFERFLDDSGMTRRKLRTAVCRDLRLEEYAVAQRDEQSNADGPRDRRARRAKELTPWVLETLERARADQTSPVPESTVTSSLTRDYGTPLTGEFTGLIFNRGTWTAGFYFNDGHVMDGLEHERLLVIGDRENRIRLKTKAYPRVLYLADDRVILSATQDDEPNTVIRVEGDTPELAAENYSGSTWLRPLGTLPLTYMDVLERGEVGTPAVTPRGKSMGTRLVYQCAISGDAACIDATFAIDVLSADEAQTWAIFQYPSVDGERVYARNCAMCHSSDGRGLEQTHPPLVGTRWTTGLLGARALIESVALGTDAESLAGETTIKGETYESELMPRFVDHLPPRKVRAVVNYVAASWGNDGPQVTEAQVIDVYCDHGVEVVYRARTTDAEMARMIERARSEGDCGEQVRAELESLDQPVPGEAMERAEFLYEANCAACHGSSGRGNGPAGGALEPGPTDFTDPDSWDHGGSVADAYLSIAEGNAGTAMSGYADRFDHQELKALAQLSVGWLPDDARTEASDQDAAREYCRAETERRRLTWDRCSSRSD